jgi:restriction system protein
MSLRQQFQKRGNCGFLSNDVIASRLAGKVPSFDDLMNPLLRAMQALGGTGSVEEIYDKVVELERFPDDVVAQPHDPEKSNQTELGYRLAWAAHIFKEIRPS